MAEISIRRRSVLLVLLMLSSAGVCAENQMDDPERLTSIVRVWGNPAMEKLMRMWQVEFQKEHPGIDFEYRLRSTALAMPALCTDVADVVLMGRLPRPIEVTQFSFAKQRLPAVIPVANGSYDIEGKSWPLVVYVHRDNPIHALTMEQLDAIFGAQRSGGWNAKGTQWMASSARGSDANIRTWGQLGLAGDWGGQAITPYGFDISSSSTAIAFGDMVFNGGDMWNEALQEVAPGSVGDEVSTGSRITALLASDRYGIAIAGIQHANEYVRAIAIAKDERSEYLAPSKEAVKSGNYPLVRSIYLAFDDHPSNPHRDLLRAFSVFVLGKEGQGIVEEEGEYLRLPTAIAEAEMSRMLLD